MKPSTTKIRKSDLLDTKNLIIAILGTAVAGLLMATLAMAVIAISTYRAYRPGNSKPTITEQLSQEEKAVSFDQQVGDSPEAKNLTEIKIQKPKKFAIRGYCFLRADSAHSNYYYILLVQFRPARQGMRCYVQKDTPLGKYLFEKFKSGYGDVMTIECQWGDGKWIDDDEALIVRIAKEG